MPKIVDLTPAKQKDQEHKAAKERIKTKKEPKNLAEVYALISDLAELLGVTLGGD